MTNQTISELAPFGLDEPTLYWRDGLVSKNERVLPIALGMFELEEHARFCNKHIPGEVLFLRVSREPYQQSLIDAIAEARSLGFAKVSIFRADRTTEWIPV